MQPRSPSPRPSPLGRGRTVLQSQSQTCGWIDEYCFQTKGDKPGCPLSPRERAKVRGNGAEKSGWLQNFLIRSKENAANGFSAEISVTMPEIQLGPAGKLPTEYAKRLEQELARLIQPIADFRFGAKGVCIECQEATSGSLTFAVVLTAIAGGGYRFVKDYDKLRTNVGLLASDIKRAGGKIKRQVLKYLGDPKNPFKK